MTLKKKEREISVTSCKAFANARSNESSGKDEWSIPEGNQVVLMNEFNRLAEQNNVLQKYNEDLIDQIKLILDHCLVLRGGSLGCVSRGFEDAN